MVKVDKQHENMGKYYLPHHTVVKDTSLTTKTRVVFDASAKTSNGYSFNDAMMIGPRRQDNIFDIIIKWRQWKFVVTADIEKMYRQINSAEEHQEYHRIFWREQPKDNIREYKLTTVTYGTAAAPFLAVRTLQEVANQSKDKDTRIKEIIREEFYVYDLMTGANNEDECRYIIRAVSENLSNAGFQLRKWSSNNQNLLTGIMSNDEQKIINVKEGDTMKTLGLHWDPDQDEFRFVIDSSKLSISKTKRNVLSNIAKIFDPIGWLTPVTIKAKIFIQRLWQSNYDWDDELDEIMKAEWMTFQQNLQEIKLIKIPRWIFNDEAGPIEIHGFADASEKAYAAVIYVKTNMTIKILTAKTKVAPIKNKKTLPKLELCAAQLLAKLLNKIKKYFSNDTKYYGWSDSTITLWWIKNNKSKEKFIRSRVADIKSLMDKIEWLHLNSKDNPVDVASRGICPSKIAAHELWCTGPQWLKQSKHHWPQQQHLAPSTDLKTMSTLQCKKHFVSPTQPTP
ncbi:uncharacterized protein LOC129905551 [Episyrphus balteatus]|uniref:uncharacterized protein LOC129905551 n=1 Tax=Episyrphus balteatus TaxID=286459 RepID=UPI00248599B4|nr:uncharacterized protein LOC129905551 [Episyrphus balteatus]